ncbi:copper resistance CopC/CopD family protein [Amycolatopsis tucumanensis]|uniref:Copper resistance protein CopC n=1 Tax=Amycolatopsis tucumanensis TaxID=401106 RepID=A0ABP7JIK3_9PSEU|nr:copper resistance protein CopC [Amycolatopsis tucumanensis]MCF6425236.1 copper resistance protein CopC/CopD [Amycolatopsis tucumanensis]
MTKPTWRRTLGRVAVLLVVLVTTTLAGAAPASAHPTLLFTEPATDTAVPDTPAVVTLVFNETVTIGPRAITLLDSAGRPLPMGDTSTARDGTVVTARPVGALQPGTYVVRWQVTGSDGDLVDEEFRFAVGTAVTGATASSGSQVSWVEAALRWLLFAGLAVALGGVVGKRLTRSARTENPTLHRVRSWVVPGGLVGLPGVAGLAALLVTDTGTVSALWQGRAGQLLLAEAAGLAVALALAALGRQPWAAAPLLVVVAAEGLRSHANVAAPGWGAVLTGVHLAAVAIWVGALLHVVRAAVAWRRERPAVRWVLFGYARLAVWVFLTAVATGTITALLLVPLPALVTTTYGQVLLVKLALVTVVAGLALTARLGLRRAEHLGRVRRLARLESTVLVAVLAVSAALVSTPPVGSQPPTPPPARGQVIPLGTLAGQIGVSAAASDGQLVVRLTTPRRGDYYAPQEQQDYTLSGQQGRDRETAAPLEFRGCGVGCFVSTVDWHEGDNVVTLRAEASTWRGGTVSLLVAWPPQSGADELARAVAALRTVERVTVYETVTSDTTTGAGTPQKLDLTGAFFLSQEPYASGVAPIAARISRSDQPVRLALGYPAASANVLLTLDNRGRISEETLTDDKHLVHRRFLYPDHD